MHGIKRTLLKSLFLQRRQIDRRDYALKRQFLFPDETLFQEFLKSDDSQECEDLARRILIRLVFEHRFAPPSRLIFNLLQHQEDDSAGLGRDSGDYIPRDHFVHLVNLYLLGIYLYSHHAELHQRCKTELHRLRRTLTANNTHGEEKKIVVTLEDPLSDGYELFGTLWASFTLGHDLAYPMELIKPDERKIKFERQLKSYELLGFSIQNDLGLKACAKLMVLYDLLASDDETQTFEDYYPGIGSQNVIRYVPKENGKGKDASDIAFPQGQKWAAAQHLVGHRGGTDIKTLRTIGEDAKLCAVLEDCSKNEPIAIVFGFLNHLDLDPRCALFFPKLDRPPAVPVGDGRLWALAFRDGASPSPNYQWRYFAQDIRKQIDAAIQNLLVPKDKNGPDFRNRSQEGKRSVASFHRIRDEFCAEEEYKRKRFTKSHTASDLGAAIYWRLCSSLNILRCSPFLDDLDSEKINDTPSRHFRRYAAVTEEIARRLFETTGKVAQEVFRGAIEREFVFFQKTLLKPAEEAAKNVVTKLFDEPSRLEITSRLSTRIDEEIRKAVEINQDVLELHSHIKALIQSTTGGKAKELFSDGALRDAQTSLKNLWEAHFPNEPPKAFRIPEKLGGMSYLLEKYRPKWWAERNAPENSFWDHGLSGAMLQMGACRIYYDLLQLSEPKVHALPAGGHGIVQVAMNIVGASELNAVRAEWKLIAWEVGATIAMHNLYPTELPDAAGCSYRTSLDSAHPFTFLCLLADGLQRWDRKYLARVSGLRPGLHLAVPHFDLQIEGNDIHIILEGRDLRMAEEAGLRSILDSYLKGASAMIKFTFSDSNGRLRK